ncbi:helix-turn-helix domain-containing protein [Polynucleobacter paneuropaeus]|nr:helix-turn-helix domain-containing protein [Polynucleobacter paneuropaeus]
MNLAEIQSFKQIGRRLRSEREERGLTLPVVAGLCGMSISELVRIENGELLGFRQVLEDALTNAEVYAKALDVELDIGERQHSGMASINAKNDDVFIPVFLRKK